MIAFGLTAYDENYESIEDDDYGTLKAFYKTWGMADAPGVEFTEIPSAPCTRAQLGLPDEETGEQKPGLFYPLHKNSVNDLTYYNKKFKCINSEFVRMQGDYNSAVTRSIVIEFEKCNQEGRDRPCKSNEEILRWLRRKFILTYAN